MSDYLKIVYSKTRRPYTEYPEQLCHYLFNKYKMCSGMRFLEVGCGRGDFLKCFRDLGLDTHGIDISIEAQKFQSDIPVKICDVENKKLPYSDNSFDIIYTKSFLEHLYYPERFYKEACRILKPGGLFLNLVPDWESNYKTYFDDFTHRTPFTKTSLKDIYSIFEFEDISVCKFRQLPIVWRFPVLNYLCTAISPFIPVHTKIKFFRWSRELMLLGSGRKRVD